MRIGAMVTAAELGCSAAVQDSFPMLAATARQLGTVAVRNAVTVGGNICAGIPAADCPPSLAALDATLTIVNTRNTQLPRESAGKWAEAMRLSASPADYGALVHVAVCARMDRSLNRWTDVRVAIGGARSQPSRIHVAEQLLEQGEWDASRIEEAAHLIEAEATLSDLRASATHRGRLAGVALTRILNKARHQHEPDSGGESAR
jgi:CO/xanthine dehydrogenase FAD-binding subunit